MQTHTVHFRVCRYCAYSVVLEGVRFFLFLHFDNSFEGKVKCNTNRNQRAVRLSRFPLRLYHDLDFIDSKYITADVFLLLSQNSVLMSKRDPKF